jgi:hypothetical protein
VRKYEGCISAIKDGRVDSRVATVQANSPMQATQLLKDICKQEYPTPEGWYSHDVAEVDIKI